MDDAIFQFEIARHDQPARHGRAQARHIVGMDVAEKVFAQQPLRSRGRVEGIKLGYAFVEEEAVTGHVIVPDADAADGAQRQAGEVLRVAQGPVAGADLGDVARRAVKQAVLFDGGPRKDAIVAVARAEPVLKAQGAVTVGQADNLVACLLQVVGMAHPVGRTAQKLVLRPAEDMRPGRADAQPHAGRVGDQERVLRQGPQPVALGQLFGDLALQRRVQLGQGGFGRLARGDLDRRSHGADTRARRIEQALALGRDPADDTVLLADGAVFNVVDRTHLGIERRGEGDARRLAIVRVQAGIEVGHAAHDVGRNAEHRLGAVRPGQNIGRQVQVPGPDLGGLGRQAQRFLRDGQPAACAFERQLGAAAVVDIDQHARKAQGVAVRIHVDAAIGLDPHPTPVAFADAVLDAVKTARGQGGFEVRADIVQIVGMDGGQQAFDIDARAHG